VAVVLDFQPVVIGHFLGDVVDLLGNSPLFQFDDGTVFVKPPLFVEPRFTARSGFLYRPSASMPRIALNPPESEADPRVAPEPTVTPYDRFHWSFAAFRRALPSPTATFTEGDVQSFLAADDSRGEDAASLAGAVRSWIAGNAVEVEPEGQRAELAEERRLKAVALAADDLDWATDPVFVSIRGAVPFLEALDSWVDARDSAEKVFRLRPPDSV
jgi:hypothetical protein